MKRTLEAKVADPIVRYMMALIPNAQVNDDRSCKLFDEDLYTSVVPQRALLIELIAVVLVASLGANALSEVFVSGAKNWMRSLLLIAFVLLLIPFCYLLSDVSSRIQAACNQSDRTLNPSIYNNFTRDCFFSLRARVFKALIFGGAALICLLCHAALVYTNVDCCYIGCLS